MAAEKNCAVLERKTNSQCAYCRYLHSSFVRFQIDIN